MLLVLIATIITIVLVVIIHYEVLTHLSKTHFRRKWHARLLLPVGVLIVIFTHIVEVWLFSITYFALFTLDGTGGIIGDFDYGFFDCIYFSFVNYTTLGYGDLVPTGHIRFVAGSEALVGLVTIAWSASFTYLEMQRMVNRTDVKKHPVRPDQFL